MQPTWEDTARALPYGSSRKVMHCGSSPAARAYNKPNGISLNCFRCGENLFIPHGPRSAAEILAARQATTELIQAREIPSRAIHLTDEDCPSEALLWPLKTGLTPEAASDDYGMRYDPVTRRVLIPLDGGFLARAVYNERPKYIKAGAQAVEDYTLFIDHDLVVITEDILSAIKVYRSGFSAMALLGTSVTATMAAKIGQYKHVVNWTDGDKAGDAAYVKLRKRLGLYPVQLHRVRTTADPKELHIKQIQTLISENTHAR
tara:strand:- start:192 stop:971 length:780 start_codon:yes stop_codon:yes gene_type:complete